jgi:SOS-response transcriptional repressor LexA
MFIATEDYNDRPLDLNNRLIQRPAATFFMIADESSEAFGVRVGDLLVIDRGEPATPGRLAVTIIQGNLVLRRLPSHSRNDAEIDIWGVVIWIIHAP